MQNISTTVPIRGIVRMSKKHVAALRMYAVSIGVATVANNTLAIQNSIKLNY